MWTPGDWGNCGVQSQSCRWCGGSDGCQFVLGLCYRPLREPVRTGLDVELMPKDNETARTEGPDEARLSGLAGAEGRGIKT